MLRVIHLGLGKIGECTIETLLAQSKFMQLAAVVDINPAFAGKSLREVMNSSQVPALPIVPSLKEALKLAKKADIATVTTASTTVQIQPTINQLVDAGLHVATTCEELANPEFRNPRIAAELDRRARKNGVAIIGTGVNPGFAMDAFALACTAPCSRVRHIKVIRSLDASKRRFQLQKKVGAGESVARIKRMIKQGAIGHVGLKESVALIARGLGWKLDDITEKFTPIAADHVASSDFFTIQPGQVRGLHMVSAGLVGKKKVIELELTMAFDADTFDEVIVEGDPPLLVRTKSGFPGEASTVGLLVNCARVLPDLKPGLRTMLDILQVRSIGV